MEETPSLSPMAVAYLAADRIAKPGGPLGSIHAPVGGAKVIFGDLCAKLFAATFLHVRDAGSIDFGIAEQRTVVARVPRVTLRAHGLGAALHPSAAHLYDCIVDGGGASDAVRRWYADDCVSPWSVVMQAAYDEVIAAGLVRDAEHRRGGAIGAMRVGLPHGIAVRERSAEIAALADPFAQRWLRFVTEERVLAAALVEDCYQGVKSRVKTAVS
ncbi:MAG: hypothetical protein ACYCUI_03760 [Vulcanimicrobiaceae bacterium]